MHPRRSMRLHGAACLIALGLAWAPPALPSGKDLDKMSEAALRKAMHAELMEIFTRGGLKPNQRYSIEVLYTKMIEALHDDGDTDDEDDIDWEDLEAEMAEIGTTVEHEVEDALEQLVAEERRAPASPFVLVADRYAQASRSATRPASVALTAVENRLVGDVQKNKR